MKLSVAVADERALPEAFVVWRGFRNCFPKAKELGYDGVELALRRVTDIPLGTLDSLLLNNDLEVSAITTGQVYADGNYCLTDENVHRRKETLKILLDMVDMAEQYGGTLNLGRVRGRIISDRSEEYFNECVSILCEHGIKRKVTILIEPVNRYEINYINSLDDGAKLINNLKIPNLKLMPDVFHMNIEDDIICNSLIRNQQHVYYIHLADSNRYAPGWGHIDFRIIFDVLNKIDFSGWASIEILPYPNPDKAAYQAISFLKPYL